MKFYVESNSETNACSQNYQITFYFCNTRKFTYFIPNMVQNNTFNNKIRVKSKRTKSNKLNELKNMTGDSRK